MSETAIRDFVVSYLHEIEATVKEADGVYTVDFPAGRKRRFGGQRRFTFDAAKAQAQVEVLEPGSPLLKLMVVDARGWGGIGVSATAGYEAGTLFFTFQLTTFSSLKKRVRFLTAVLGPEATTPTLVEGIHDLFTRGAPDAASFRNLEKVQNSLPMVLPFVESAGHEFAKEAVKESEDAFRKSLGRVNEYFQGMRQETASEEARIKKRLGEIQSKLYFAEDGLRQLKLERERDRLTQELYQLKQKHTQHEERLSTDQLEHVERQRRRHEPKLSIRLLAATLVTSPASSRAPAPAPAPVAPPEPVQPSEPAQPPADAPPAQPQ